MTYTPRKVAGVSTIGKVKLPSYFMLALTLIGIADAVYVAHGNYAGAPLWCPILDGCNTVINSPYSRVFGVPMSYFGFIYYVFMFGLAARLAYDPFSNSLRFRAILYAALGAASSMYFMYLQIGFIGEVCSYCLISAVTSLLLLFAALWHFQAKPEFGVMSATGTKRTRPCIPRISAFGLKRTLLDFIRNGLSAKALKRGRTLRVARGIISY